MTGFDLSTISNCYIGGAQASAIYLGSNKIWPATQHDYSQDPLTFEVLEDGQFKYDIVSTTNTSTMHYSLDNGATWDDIQDNVWTATIPAGSKIIFNWNDPSVVMGWGIGTFYSTGRFNVSGNILSLINGIDFNNGVRYTLHNYEFARLFYGCQYLISAKNLILPPQTIIYSCYQEMFRGCTSLTSAPALPATTLADFCYSDMFNGCTSLTTAPALPATTLTITCYGRMFNGCTSLTSAPELPATTLTQNCYLSMFTSCTSLTSAPELPATILAQSCYKQMFDGCTSLNSVTCLATDISATDCTSNWLNSVSATGTFTKAASMNDWTTGVSGIPSGWTVVNASNT